MKKPMKTKTAITSQSVGAGMTGVLRSQRLPGVVPAIPVQPKPKKPKK